MRYLKLTVIATLAVIPVLTVHGQGQRETLAWAPVPSSPNGWVAPNKPHTKLADVTAAHKAEPGWRQAVVRDSLLQADYVQMAHHGQGGVEKEVYEVVRPTYCLWPTPSWLWDNMGPGGYDTGAFRTVIVRGWISSLRCVKKHYRMTEGTQVIDLAAE
jgi:hypothetical protein